VHVLHDGLFSTMFGVTYSSLHAKRHPSALDPVLFNNKCDHERRSTLSTTRLNRRSLAADFTASLLDSRLLVRADFSSHW